MHDQAYVNRKHQIWSVMCLYGERGFTPKELKADIRLNGINPNTISIYVSKIYHEGLLHREPLPGKNRGYNGVVHRYFTKNLPVQMGYTPTSKTGGDVIRKAKMLYDASINKDGSYSTKRVNIDGSEGSNNDHHRLYFQNEEQVLGMIEFLICNIENFTYADELEIDTSALPKSPIGTDPSFWKSKKTTAKIGSVTPKDLGRKTDYPQLAKTDKRGKKK